MYPDKPIFPGDPFFTMLLWLFFFKALLDNEDEEMQHSEGQERSGDSFNYGSYHSLEAVSVSTHA